MITNPESKAFHFKALVTEIKASEVLYTPEQTLGHKAVQSLNEQAAFLTVMQQPGLNSRVYTRLNTEQHSAKTQAAYAAQRAKYNLRGLSEQQTLDLDEYMEESAAPFFRKQLETKNEGRTEPFTWSRWLSSELMSPSATTFVNVLQWHNDVIERQTTNPEVQQLYVYEKARFLHAADILVRNGDLALGPKDIANPHLVIGDVFTMHLNGERGRFDLSDPTAITVSQGVGKTYEHQIKDFKSRFLQIGIHEFVHQYLNRSLETPESPMHVFWLNEALTEHITREIRAQLDEDASYDAIYAEQRNVLLALGKTPETQAEVVRLAMRGYSGTDEDRAAFTSYLDALWGTENVLEKVSLALAKRIAIYTAKSFTNNPPDTDAAEYVADELAYAPESILGKIK